MQYIKEEVRQRILSAAKEEFFLNSFDKASIRKIVKKADISLGNLYRYYRDKSQLFDAVINPVVENCLKSMNSLSFKGDSFETVAFHMSKFASENITIFKIMEKRNFENCNSFLNRLSDVIATKLKEDMDIPDSNLKMVKILSFSFINGLRQIMENLEDQKTTQKNIETLLNIMFKNLKDKI